MKLIVFELQQKYSINFNNHKINNHSPTAKPNLKYVTNINYIYSCETYKTLSLIVYNCTKIIV